MKKLLKRAVYLVLVLFVLLNVMAAFHAHNFTHFYDTQQDGHRFRPENAGFLDKAKAIAFGVKAYKMPVLEKPSVKFNTVYLYTTDSLKLEAWHLVQSVADSSKAKGTVILFHGHGGNKEGVLSESEAFYRMGYNVLLCDFRAHGNSEGNVCTIGYNESSDVKAAFDFISSTGESNIILWGISLGAAAEMKAVAEFDLKPSKMILEMPFGSLVEAVEGRCRIMGVPAQPTAGLLTFWGGVQHGFWAFDLNPEEYAASIQCPVLLQWGEKDIRVSRKETENIYHNLAASNKSLVLYQQSGHQSLFRKEGAKWLHTVAEFLSN